MISKNNNSSGSRLPGFPSSDGRFKYSFSSFGDTLSLFENHINKQKGVFVTREIFQTEDLKEMNSFMKELEHLVDS